MMGNTGDITTTTWMWGNDNAEDAKIPLLHLLPPTVCLVSTFPHISDARSPISPCPTVVLLFISQT